MSETQARWYESVDGVTFERWPVARKAHQCDVCRMAIQPGTQYLRVVVPACADRYALHRGCNVLLRHLHADMELRYDEGVEYSLAEEFAEEYGYTFDPESCAWAKAAENELVGGNMSDERAEEIQVAVLALVDLRYEDALPRYIEGLEAALCDRDAAGIEAAGIEASLSLVDAQARQVIEKVALCRRALGAE